MASAGYGPVKSGKLQRDDEDGLVDEWGVRYEGHHKPGGGTFGRRKGTRRRIMYLAAAAIVLVIVIVIISVAVQKHAPVSGPHQSPTPQTHDFGRWKNNTANGLTAYPHPQDGSELIMYNTQSTGEGSYRKYTGNLEVTLHGYRMHNQQSHEFTACNKSNMGHYVNRVCQFDSSVLSPCDQHHHYGYSAGRPCILLKLNLPRNVSATPFANDSSVAATLGNRYDPDYIGVTCDGETEEDRKHLDDTHGKMKPIDYLPKQGFPAWVFRPRTIDKFLPPVMMVRFNTLKGATYIRIKCTAWAKSFNNGRPENSTLYSTSFVINHI